MPDMEKVTKALEKALAISEAVDSGFIWITVGEAKQVLELLEEQEPVKPMDGWLCGQCGCRIYQDANYCYNCGRAVKWDADT
jgi:hypothetical protein